MEIKVKNNCISVIIEKEIPCKECSVSPDPELSLGFVLDITGAFSDEIINALKKRLEACEKELTAKIHRVIGANHYQIFYRRDNDSIHSFNIPTYTAIKDGIKALEEGNYKAFIDNTPVIEQTIKAFAIHGGHRIGNVRGFYFEDLIRIYFDILRKERFI